MRKKQVWRYYCEHCPKSGCSGGHMRKHEAHCCSNPDRKCRMCEFQEAEQQPIAVLIAALEAGLKWNGGTDPEDKGFFDADLTKLRELSQSCPACILAAIMQLRKRDPEHDYYIADFNFRNEAREFLNATAAVKEGRSWLA